MAEKLDVPAIRFKGFTGAWEQHELGDAADVIDPHPSHRAPIERASGIPFVGIGDVNEVGLIVNNATRIVDVKIYEEHRSRYDLSKPSLGIGRVASLGKVIRLRNDIGKYAISPTMAIVQFHSIVDNDYAYSYMSSCAFQDQFTSKSSGSTRQSVGIQNLRKLQIKIPFDCEEQSQIGTLFWGLDNLITLHQRKLSQLKNVKKALLEKMFPQKGKSVPEIRFAGFADAWEQRELGTLVEVKSGKDYKHLAEGEIPVYGTGGYMLSVNEALSYHDDAVGIGRKGTIDKPYLLESPFWTVDTLFYAIPRANIDLNFIFALFQNIDWKSKDESTGVPSLSKVAITKTDILVPDHKEQQQIGKCFIDLDNLITLHQRKHEKLLNIKKALLEKMFI